MLKAKTKQPIGINEINLNSKEVHGLRNEKAMNGRWVSGACELIRRERRPSKSQAPRLKNQDDFQNP